MNCLKAMLSVVMDGIKDANMMMEYAREAKAIGKTTEADWFHSHADKRIESLCSDWEFVKKMAGLDERSRAMDPIVDTLYSHVNDQIKDIKLEQNSY